MLHLRLKSKLLSLMVALCASFVASSLLQVSKRSFPFPTGASRSAPVCAAMATDGGAKVAYNKLCDHAREISRLQSVMALLGWDEITMMKDGSAGVRANQKATLAGCIHEKETSDQLGKAINEVEKEMKELNEWESAVVRDVKRGYQLATRVTKELEERMSRLTTKGQQVWVKARKEKRFDDFAPVLQEILDAKLEYAKASRPDMSPYDGCIDMCDRGMTAKRLDEIFGQVKKPLQDLLKKIMSRDQPKVLKLFDGGDAWDTDAQETLCKDICNAMGFDTSRGRIDTSAHPFTVSTHPLDVRFTTRYSKEVPFEGIMGAIHETGHALYEQGRNQKHDWLPVTEAITMGVHESQSLLWERHVGQSKEFWQYCVPLMHKYLPDTKSANAEDFYNAVNRVKPSLIRVEADEVTYPFHVMIRFEIEKALAEGSLAVKDLPEVWNKKMKEYLDVDVPDDAQGVLQDVHWSIGAFGYFPSYLLGAMTAAQIFHFAEQNLPNLKDNISKGQFSELREFLKEKVHEVGSLYSSPDELLKNVTGEPLEPKYFLEYLSKKYCD